MSKLNLNKVAALIAAMSIPKERSAIRPLIDRRVYRGSVQYVVGYTWSKSGSNMYSGRVYDCVLGWGETFESAMDKAQVKIAKQKDQG